MPRLALSVKALPGTPLTCSVPPSITMSPGVAAASVEPNGDGTLLPDASRRMLKMPPLIVVGPV